MSSSNSSEFPTRKAKKKKEKPANPHHEIARSAQEDRCSGPVPDRQVQMASSLDDTAFSWLDYTPLGSRIASTPFVCCKTPLHAFITRKQSPSDNFTIDDFVAALPLHKHLLIINLTGTNRYYNHDRMRHESSGSILIAQFDICQTPTRSCGFVRTVTTFTSSTRSTIGSRRQSIDSCAACRSTTRTRSWWCTAPMESTAPDTSCAAIWSSVGASRPTRPSRRLRRRVAIRSSAASTSTRFARYTAIDRASAHRTTMR